MYLSPPEFLVTLCSMLTPSKNTALPATGVTTVFLPKTKWPPAKSSLRNIMVE